MAPRSIGGPLRSLPSLDERLSAGPSRLLSLATSTLYAHLMIKARQTWTSLGCSCLTTVLRISLLERSCGLGRGILGPTTRWTRSGVCWIGSWYRWSGKLPSHSAHYGRSLGLALIIPRCFSPPGGGSSPKVEPLPLRKLLVVSTRVCGNGTT